MPGSPPIKNETINTTHIMPMCCPTMSDRQVPQSCGHNENVLNSQQQNDASHLRTASHRSDTTYTITVPVTTCNCAICSSQQPIKDECCADCCPLVATQSNQESYSTESAVEMTAVSSETASESTRRPTSRKRKKVDEDDDTEDDDDDTVPRSCEWAACAESFPTLDDLTPHLFKNHLNSRSNNIDYHCRWGTCTVTVDGSDALLSHLTHHLGQRLIHGCRWTDCGQRFGTFDELTGHLSEEHVGTGQSEYICNWERCYRQGKTFSQRQKVMRHIQTHTGDKPYQCTICRKRFSESNIMTQHLRTHTGERPYKCTEQGCTRQFSIASALTIHRRVHSGERPFACKYQDCDKKFAESSNLTKHMRVHTGERPFRCSVTPCGKAFSRPDQVSRHLKTHKRHVPKDKS